jgi:hypothetical protein
MKTKTKKLTAGKQMSFHNKSNKDYDNSIHTQCARLLRWLKNGEQLTTFELRKRGLMHPAGRINNLRNSGLNIITHRTWERDNNGVEHFFAKYILISSNLKGGNHYVD